MIKIKEIDPKFTNADAETRRQLRDLAIEEAFKSAVSEEQLEKLNKQIALSLTNLNNKLSNLDIRLTALDKQIADLEKPKSILEVKVEPKEVPSTSLLENIIKLFKK